MTRKQQREKYSANTKNSPNEEDNDIKKMKDYLSNERTFLAWVRTGLTIFTLGCAIGRFGGTGNTTTTSLTSPNAEKKPLIAGIILAFIGILSIIYGIWRFVRTHRKIERKRPSDRPDITGPIISILVLTGGLIAVIIIIFIL